MRCVGIANARARGLDLSDEDIVVDGHQISVKASFTGGRQAIRLINTLGDDGAEASGGVAVEGDLFVAVGVHCG